MDESLLRGALDEFGILRSGVLSAPSPAYLVFAQRHDAFIDLAAWQNHARRFFDTQLGLTVDKHYTAPLPRIDATHIVVAHTNENGTRFAFARPANAEDTARAEAAETAPAGLADLARRCKTVWLVESTSEGDRIALRIAAILASVLLGPIVTPDLQIFGVKTARIKLEH